VLFCLVVFPFYLYVLLVDFLLGRGSVDLQRQHFPEITVILYHRSKIR
jgi:hypothetical protein